MKRFLLRWMIPLLLIALLLVGCQSGEAPKAENTAPNRAVNPFPGLAEDAGQADKDRQGETKGTAEEPPLQEPEKVTDSVVQPAETMSFGPKTSDAPETELPASEPGTELANQPPDAEAPAEETNAAAETEEAVVTTEEELEPQPISDDLTLHYTREDWKRINTFLSNFSEVFFLEYDVFSERMDPEDALRDEYELVRYGYLHLKINDSAKVKSDGYNYVVTRADMDKCLNRFLGHTVSAGDKSRTYATQYGDYTETAEYKNSAYYFPAADGEAYNQFTVVNRVMLTVDDCYYVEFNVYSLDLETYFDTGLNSSYYQMTASEALLDSRLTYEYSGSAKVRDYQSGTYRSYSLVDYRIYR